MNCLGRFFGLLLIFLILMITPCAFWVFNVDRVAVNPQTYKTALGTQNFYDTILPALVDGTATDNDANPQIRSAARSLIRNMSNEDWALLADNLLPPTWLQEQLDGNIDRLFTWLQGSRTRPDIQFNLTILKDRLNSDASADAAKLIVPKLPTCTTQQEKAITNPDPEKQVEGICNPESKELQTTAVNNLTNVFKYLGAQMPDAWRLSDHLNNPTPGGVIEIKGENHRPITEADMNRFRAFIWLDSRLVILLFLIPVALFAMVIMATIRSSKQFFRWLGWGLILSGILTLLPVPLISPALFGDLTGVHAGANGQAGGEIIGSLMGGMISSIVSGLTLAVLTQVAVVIVIGFVAVFISVLLRTPEPDVSNEELAMEKMQLAMNYMGQTPTPTPMTPFGGSPYGPQMGSTPRPFGSTAAQIPTPPPAPSAPPPNSRPASLTTTMVDDPLVDLFPNDKQ